MRSKYLLANFIAKKKKKRRCYYFVIVANREDEKKTSYHEASDECSIARKVCGSFFFNVYSTYRYLYTDTTITHKEIDYCL